MKTTQLQTEMTVEEYICYLYLSIADADMTITDKELESVRTSMKRILSRHHSTINLTVDAIIYTTQCQILQQSEEEKKHLISSLSKKYPLPADVRLDIISDLHELIHADEFVALSEYNMLNYIRLCLTERELMMA